MDNDLTSRSGGRPSRFDIRAYSAAIQVGVVAMQVVAVANLAYLVMHIVHDIVHGEQTAPPIAMAFGLVLLSGVPWLAVAFVQRRLAATFDIEKEHWVLSLRRARIEIPPGSVKSIRPFLVPLPGSGLLVTMNSGRTFRLGVDEPGALLASLAGAFEPARGAALRPEVAYADAKRRYGQRWRYLTVTKWLILPLLIALVLFRLDQYIVFGGPFGQYQMFGLGPYLKSFATYWVGTTSYLVIYASVVRICVELLAILVTSIAPLRAGVVRRIAEGLCLLMYFGLIPAYIAVRLLL